MNVGLTGGIACGKTTVAAMLAARGALLVDADRIAREVVEPGRPALRRIAERFGQAVLNPDGTLDRKALGRIVFADAQARKELEAIVHPDVLAEMDIRMRSLAERHPGRPVVADVPLLYELGMQHRFDEVIVVYVPKDVQVERLMARDRIGREEAERRLKAQLPIEDKRRMADVVIDNSGDLAETERQVDDYWRKKGWR